MPDRLFPLLASLVVAPVCVLAEPAKRGGEADLPEGLKSSVLAGAEVVPSPSALCAAPTGEVFVGVDLLGSLGKGSGKGRIVRLVDGDNDGKAEEHTVFAKVDNPRGLVVSGRKVFVLHTVIPEGKKLTGMHLSVFDDADWDGVADLSLIHI